MYPGPTIAEFVGSSATGLFRGHHYNASDLTLIDLYHHIAPEF